MKKRISAFLIMLAFVFLSSCSKVPDYEGYEQLEHARNSFAQLNSGKIKVVDLQTDIVTQELVFQFDENKNMLFRYKGTDGTTIYEEYHNGKELYYTTDGEWTGEFFTSGEGSYYGYFDTNRHSLATSEVFYANEYAVNGSQISENNGKTIIKLSYDLDKLIETAKNTVEQKGNFTFFETVYEISDNSLTSYTQTAEFDKNGEKSKIQFRIEIDEQNVPQKIEKPEYSSDKNA